MRVDYSYRSREIDLYGAACWNWLTKIEIDSDFYSAPAYVIIVSGVWCWVDWNTARSASNLVPASGWNLNRLSSHVAILVPDSGDHVCLVLADCVGVLDINLSEVTWWATNIDNYVVDVRESKAVIIVATVAVIWVNVRLQALWFETIGRIEYKKIASAGPSTNICWVNAHIANIIDRWTIEESSLATLTSNGIESTCWIRLAVHEKVKGVIIELVNVVGWNLHVIDSDTNRNWCNSNAGVENFGNPKPHIPTTCAKRVLMKYFDSCRLSRRLWHD